MGKEIRDKQNKNRAERPKPGIRQWIWCIVACVATIAFVIWTGYWAVLILLPVFIDIYITKFIPWGAWKESKNPTTRKILDWVDAIVFALIGVYFITTFFFQNYQIPSSSLEKSLLVGDFLCVNKMVYGARAPMTPLSFPLMQHTAPIIGTKSYLEKPQLEYKRFAGFRSIERYDIVVFNYPSGDTVATKHQSDDYYRLCAQDGWHAVNTNKAEYGDIIYRPVDRRENYVKRCVGLPGDIIEIREDTTFINGAKLENPEMMQLFYVIQTDGTQISTKVFEDLGMSMEDQNVIYPPQLLQANSDSMFLKELGLKSSDKETLLYQRVNMTKEMVDKMLQKPFVLSVTPWNKYINVLREKDPISYVEFTQTVYPVTYYKSVSMGDFPATWIPKKGETLVFDENIAYKVAVYERCIKNYEHNDFEYKDGKVYINGQQADSYTFKYDYYFMMGDNRDRSADSRLWGFVPEDHIVGSPMFIWLSLDSDKSGLSKIRWNRIFTKGNKNK